MKQINFEQEIHETFMEYTLATLTERSIPDASDGLLDVHRKLLYTLEDVLKMSSKSKTKKSASIVGSCLASVYTHGDAAAYESLCKMSQDFLMRYPLITPQGSMGTLEANGLFGAARYTEAKPSIFADLMFNDYNKNVVDKRPSYNGEYMQPNILPALLPNAIINGRESIATGLSHNSLPNNLTETCEAIIAMIEGKINNVDDLMNYMKGFDFPCGGTIINTKDIREAYATGKSKVSLKVRGDYEVKGNKIIFTSIPFRTYRKKIREQIGKNIEELEKVICDYKDASALGETKIIFEVAAGVTPEKALSYLWKYTDLQNTLSLNMNFLVNGAPKMCSMIDLINSYIEHQDDVIIRANQFDKNKAEARLHIVEGLLVACTDIDTIIALIKKSANRTEAAKALKEKFNSLTDIQIKAILDMKLGSLTKIDGVKLEDEANTLKENIAKFNSILGSRKIRNELIVDKLKNLKDKYGDKRRTKLVDIEENFKKEEVKPEPCFVTLYSDGSLKREKKIRKGRNLTAVQVVKTVEANTTDEVLIFTKSGKVFKNEVINIPEDKRIKANLFCEFLTGEEISFILIPPKEQEDKYVIFCTEKGIVKKTALTEYTSLKRAKKGAVAVKLKDGDSIVDILIAEDDQQLLLTTKSGYGLKINLQDINPIGRACVGVIGIKVSDGDSLANAAAINKEHDTLSIVYEEGKAKNCDLHSIVCQGRGTKGKRIISQSEKGFLKAIPVKSSQTLFLIGERLFESVLCKNLKKTPSVVIKDAVKDVLVLD